MGRTWGKELGRLALVMVALLAALAGIVAAAVFLLQRGTAADWLWTLRTVCMVSGAAGLLIEALLLLRNRAGGQREERRRFFSLLPFQAVWLSVSVFLLLAGGLLDYLTF